MTKSFRILALSWKMLSVSSTAAILFGNLLARKSSSQKTGGEPRRLEAIILEDATHELLAPVWFDGNGARIRVRALGCGPALSRALLEQAIKVNHVKLRIDLEEPGSRHSKSLERLIDEVKERFPQIESEMDIVRRYGNKVLHGSDQVDQVDRVQHMAKLRRDATQSIESLYAVLEMLPKLSDKMISLGGT
jgi:hypothetical protein